MEETALDDEDVSFLPGQSSSHRKSTYESSLIPKFICTRRRAIISAFIVCVVIIIVLVCALVRVHAPEQCSLDNHEIHQSTTAAAETEASTLETSTNEIRFPWKDIRLPRDVVPEKYAIFLFPNLTESSYRGTVEIQLLVLKPTDFIVFHARDLNITGHYVKYINQSKTVEIIETLKYTTFEQFYIRLDKPLSTNDRVSLFVEFNAPLISKLTGFYKSVYQTKQNETRVLATTDFEPTDARSAFPCFDEPDLKATFTLSMVRDKHHISLFNTHLAETHAHEDSELLVVDHFHESVKMSTYLVAFIVCDFANLTTHTESGITVRVFAPADNIQEGQFALDVAAKVLPFYEDFFGIKFPLQKLDLVAIPDFNSGAMENWGLTTYRTTSILFDSQESDYSAQRSVASTVAHELAHQWFGNLVTMKWWDDLWLNEGFASFVEYLGVNNVKPRWKLIDLFVTSDFRKALGLDALRTSHPIQVPVRNPNQINEIFDSISYDKGSSILRMLQHFLGMETFKRGLHNYLNTYRFSNTQTADLWRSLSEVSEAKALDVKKIMDTWTQQMGYPVVTLTKTENKIEATQERFLINPMETNQPEESPFGYKWYIPLNFISSDAPNIPTYAWMNLSTASFTLAPNTKWIKANYKAHGLYRVNYDEEMWRNLIRVLNTNHTVLSASDRAGLLDDAFSLASAGRINITVALDITTYLAKETEFTPWSVAIGHLGYIRRRLLDRPARDDFKEYILDTLAPVIDRIGWDDTGSLLDKYLRDYILTSAIALGHEKTVLEGKRRFDNWMKNGTRIDASLKSITYKAGVQYGGEKEWQFCWEKFQNSDIASEQRLFLSALAASHDLLILKRFLLYSLDPTKIRSQDCEDVIASVAKNTYGGGLAWRFVRQHWDVIRQRLGDGAFTTTRLIKDTASSFSTEFDYNEVSTFYTGRNVGSGQRAVQQVLENIRMNIEWLQSHEMSVTNWIRQNKNLRHRL